MQTAKMSNFARNPLACCLMNRKSSKIPGSMGEEAAHIEQSIPHVATPARAEEMQLSFDDVYRRFGERILNLAYRMTQDEQASRDLTQDVFLKVYQNLGGFRQDSTLYTWIYRIAANHVLNYLKRQKRIRWERLLDKSVGELLNEDRVLEPAFNVAAPVTPDRIVEDEERQRIVWGAVQHLPLNYRLPFVLFHYEGLSYAQIAESLGLSQSAVETRIHRAKGRMVEILKPWLKSI
jgi:RNA polymerase sigma-70 factor (ECF subfamily)